MVHSTISYIFCTLILALFLVSNWKILSWFPVFVTSSLLLLRCQVTNQMWKMYPTFPLQHLLFQTAVKVMCPLLLTTKMIFGCQKSNTLEVLKWKLMKNGHHRWLSSLCPFFATLDIPSLLLLKMEEDFDV